MLRNKDYAWISAICGNTCPCYLSFKAKWLKRRPQLISTRLNCHFQEFCEFMNPHISTEWYQMLCLESVWQNLQNLKLESAGDALFYPSYSYSLHALQITRKYSISKCLDYTRKLRFLATQLTRKYSITTCLNMLGKIYKPRENVDFETTVPPFPRLFFFLEG